MPPKTFHQGDKLPYFFFPSYSIYAKNLVTVLQIKICPTMLKCFMYPINQHSCMILIIYISFKYLYHTETNFYFIKTYTFFTGHRNKDISCKIVYSCLKYSIV